MHRMPTSYCETCSKRIDHTILKRKQIVFFQSAVHFVHYFDSGWLAAPECLLVYTSLNCVIASAIRRKGEFFYSSGLQSVVTHTERVLRTNYDCLTSIDK